MFHYALLFYDTSLSKKKSIKYLNFKIYCGIVLRVIKMKKSKISLNNEIIAVVASLYGMLQSLDHWMFFTYFTNLSNIFIDIMLVIFIIYDLKKK